MLCLTHHVMQQKKRLSFCLLSSLAVASLAGLVGCASSDTDPGSDIDDYIRGIGELPSAEPKLLPGEATPAERRGDYSCVRQDLEETRQYDRIVAYAANSDSLWPGAIISGNSVGEGQFTPVVLDRAPLDVSISLENLAGKKSAHLDTPSLSTLRDAMGDILSSTVTGATAANLFSEIEQVHSKEQLSLAVGAGVGRLPLAARQRRGQLRLLQGVDQEPLPRALHAVLLHRRHGSPRRARAPSSTRRSTSTRSGRRSPATARPSTSRR